MTNSCSLSGARALSAAGVVAGAVAAAAVWTPLPGADVVGSRRRPLWRPSPPRSASVLTGRAAAWIHRTREVCLAVAAGDFERRLIRLTEGGELGRMLNAVNRMVDVTDAFVREAGAAMEFVGKGRYFRTIRPEGMGGHSSSARPASTRRPWA